MMFTGSIPLGLFKSERAHSLVVEGDAVEFTTRESFSGPLLFMLGRSLHSLN